MKKQTAVEEPEHRERRIKQVCYVCKQTITGTPVYIGAGKKYPEGLWRHQRCEPGAARWMRVQEAKPKKERSELYPYFALDKRREE